MKSNVEGISKNRNFRQCETNKGDLRERKVNEESMDEISSETLIGKTEGANSFVELGGGLSVLCQLIFAIIYTLIICMICDNTRTLEQFKDWNVWFSWRSLIIYSSYLLLHGFLAFVPYFGKKTTLPDSGVIFTANGLFAFFVVFVLMILMECFNIPICKSISEEYYALFVVSVAISILLSLFAYIKGRNVSDDKRNPYGNTGSFIYDFCMGRQINTYLFENINLKVIALRCSLSACALHNLAFLYLGINVDKSTGIILVNTTLLSFVVLPCMYIVYSLSAEDKVHLTFEYHSEGTGVISLLGYALYPYSVMCIGKCILEHNIHLSPLVLCASVMISLTGQYIHYASNNEKNKFRVNSDHPNFASVTYILTPSGKRLITSGWWGFVRHPNYFAELIIHVGWSIPIISTPLALYSVLMAIYFIYRAKRDGYRCHRKHGAAWETYCKKVPYSIIPGIY